MTSPAEFDDMDELLDTVSPGPVIVHATLFLNQANNSVGLAFDFPNPEVDRPAAMYALIKCIEHAIRQRAESEKEGGMAH